MDFLRLPTSLRRALAPQLRQLHLSRGHATAPSLPLPQPPTDTEPPVELLTLTPSTLNSYTVSHAPSPVDITTARSFFTRITPEILFTSPYFRSLPPSPFPEVAFLGRSNVGKSSLLNALFGQPNSQIARTSKKPGKTRTINAFGVGGEGLIGKQAAKPARTADGREKHAKEEVWKRFGRGGLVVVDMPGYGGGSREEWGAEIMKYLENRKQLRRTYVLVDTEHGLKKSDVQLLLHLRQQGIAHQVVLSKVDKVLFPRAKAPGSLGLHKGLVILGEIRKGVRQKLDEAARAEGLKRGIGMGDLLCCSSEKSLNENKSRRIGVDELRWSVLTACGLEHTASMKQPRVKVQHQEREKPEYQSPEPKTSVEQAQFVPLLL